MKLVFDSLNIIFVIWRINTKSAESIIDYIDEIGRSNILL